MLRMLAPRRRQAQRACGDGGLPGADVGAFRPADPSDTYAGRPGAGVAALRLPQLLRGLRRR